MALPYENATSGNNAMVEIQKILKSFGVESFGQMLNYGTSELLVQFEYRGRQVSVRANAKGYAAAWLKEHPHSNRTRATLKEHQAMAKDAARYRAHRGWMAREAGITPEQVDARNDEEIARAAAASKEASNV